MLETVTKEQFLELRKKRIELEYTRLNDMQRKAVLATNGPLLLLAGAGSGKTTVLINRIANLINFGAGGDSDFIPDYITDVDAALIYEYIEKRDPEIEEMVDRACAVSPAAPWSIIAITFTNKAANELKERLARKIGEDKAKDVWAATFHSACVRILRRDIEKLGFKKDFTIYDAQDAERLMKEIMSEMGMNDKILPPKAVIGEISRAKDKLITPEIYAKNTNGDFRLEQIAKLYEKYQKRLKTASALDFDDIICHTVKLLREFPDVREYYQKKFRYVLIDEYQDTNHAQYELASLLAGGHGNICVVGDDDQSIYRFRGATIENILEFENQFANARVIRLEQNYRSTGGILDVANSVIRNNLGRKTKALWTDKGTGKLPVVRKVNSEQSEAKFIVDTILDGVSRGKKYSDFAVLYRTNAQSNIVEQTLARNAIPYRVYGGHRFFDYAEVKDMLAYLWVLQNPTDTLRLKRIINVPARKIGDKLVEKVELIAERENLTMYQVIERAEEFSELGASAKHLKAFADMMARVREKIGNGTLEELYDTLVEQTGYVDALIAKADERSQTRIENIKELKSTIMEYEKGAEEPSLFGFLDEVALYTDLEQMDESGDTVTLMTIHSAKGLEFPTVFLIGVEEGIFPGYRSIGDDNEIEEERRLFYVAATRAMKSLYMTHAATRTIFGKTSCNGKSRFIEEIPVDKYDAQEEPSAFDGFGYGKTRSFADRPSVGVQSTRPAIREIPKKKETPKISLSAGDMIRHKTFGEGMVISVRPMGGDALLEIKFEGGVKRLMQNTAGQYIEKI